MTLVSIGSLRRALGARAPRLMHTREKRAAVAAIVRPAEGEVEILLIRRAERSADRWSGHMAFPGGLAEPTDTDLEATARRETLEEVGLDLGAGGVLLGRLDDVEAIARGRPAGLVISPFVYEIATLPRLVPNEEVAEVVWAPLGPLLRGELSATYRYAHEGATLELPAFDVSGRIVWGLTHRMLEALLGLVRARD